MFGRETWRLAAFLVVFSVTQGNFTNLTEMEYEFDWACSNPKMRSSKTADELIKGNVSAKNRFVVEYAEFNEPPLLRKFQEKHFVNYKALEGNDFEMTEVSNKSVVISKCCPWNSYFDMDVYNCVEFQEEKLNVTSPQLLIGRLINYENATNYVFVESVPNCGNRSVASVRILSQVHVNDSGLSINGTFFPDYCLDEHPDRPNQTIVVTCHDPQVFCKDKTCFRKCCPLKQSYGPSGRKCQRTNNSFQPEFFDFPSLNRNEFARPFQFGIFFGHACEKRGKYLLDESEGETSFLDLTGTLYVPLYKKCFLRDDFCVEHVVFGNYSGIGSFLCFANESSDFQKSHLEYLLQSLGLILSSTFLFITLLVYLFSPKSQTLYGKTLMCYIACLFVAYLLLAVVNLKSTGLSKNSCAYIGK